MMTEQQISELLEEIQNRPEGIRVRQLLELLAWETLDEGTDEFEVQLVDVGRAIINRCRQNPGELTNLEQMLCAGELMGLASFIHCKRSREISLRKNPLDRFQFVDEKHP